ncbi:MAG: glycosyltransferase family 4 protein, partial [Rhodothermales bacterium]|nr:glycosyltransferase family 4 protein [Rhodothermales bacterium]
VLDQPFPPDIRVENEAVSLVDRGYDVSVLSIGPDDRPSRDVYKGIRVVRDKISRQRRNKMRGLAGSLPLLERRVARMVRRLHREEPVDALHVHDLYLFGGGLRAARDLGIPIVGDLHENWVEALSNYAWSTRFPARLLINLKKWKELERRWATSVDRLVVVIEEAAERNRELGVDPDKVFVISNSLNVDEFAAHAVDDNLMSRLRSPFNLVYVGGFDLHRGLDTVLRAMPAILKAVPGGTLTLVGDGRTLDELRTLAGELGIDGSVRFEGRQPHARLRSYILSADVCLVPHRRTPHTDATIPHKLFQYMFCGVPVVVSDCRPLERIVVEESAGEVFKHDDPSSMADAVIRLAKDQDRRARMGANGRRAVMDRYNWNLEATKLGRMYAGLLKLHHDLEASLE